MTSLASTSDLYFTPLGEASLKGLVVPTQFTYSAEASPHPICLQAAKELQLYLNDQKEWEHNFGLSEEKSASAIIGKMFGVLVVKTEQNEIGYLAAFSGKLAGGNHHAKFVPPVFDSLTDNSFVNIGMTELTRLNDEIKNLEAFNAEENEKQIVLLKSSRKQYSQQLQNKIFDHYFFLNQNGEEKSLNVIFKAAAYKNPPSGAGECAGPKLLHYAFQHKMKPLALAEFWWGQSPKSATWKHGHFYPCCKEKCEPILAHMLDGITGSIGNLGGNYKF